MGLGKQVEDKIKSMTKAELAKLGQKAVSFAKANGNYQDHTGHLRASNYYKVDDKGLKVGNSASYAKAVEAKGKIVTQGTKDFVKSQLNKGKK